MLSHVVLALEKDGRTLLESEWSAVGAPGSPVRAAS